MMMRLLLLLLLGYASAAPASDYYRFAKSRDALRPGMTLGEAFGAGLADYLAGMGGKNAPGATLPARQPASADCKRHVLDIGHHGSFPGTGAFQVQVYCGMNEPSAKQLVPSKSFKTKKELLQALGADYARWARSMEFRVESPPLQIGGVYDHYLFTLDERGRVDKISPLILSPSRKKR